MYKQNPSCPTCVLELLLIQNLQWNVLGVLMSSFWFCKCCVLEFLSCKLVMRYGLNYFCLLLRFTWSWTWLTGHVHGIVTSYWLTFRDKNSCLRVFTKQKKMGKKMDSRCRQLSLVLNFHSLSILKDICITYSLLKRMVVDVCVEVVHAVECIFLLISVKIGPPKELWISNVEVL